MDVFLRPSRGSRKLDIVESYGAIRRSLALLGQAGARKVFPQRGGESLEVAWENHQTVTVSKLVQTSGGGFKRFRTLLGTWQIIMSVCDMCTKNLREMDAYKSHGAGCHRRERLLFKPSCILRPPLPILIQPTSGNAQIPE